MGNLEQTECPECGQIVHYQAQRWKAQVVCSNCQASFSVEAIQPPAVPTNDPSPIPSHLQGKAEPQQSVAPQTDTSESSETFRYQRSKISGMITGAIVVVVLSVFVVGLIWGLAMLDSQTAKNQKDKREKEKEAAKKINYTLAGKKRAKLGSLEIGVKQVEYGPLRVKDQNNKVHVSSEPLLQIFVEIRSRSSNEVNYVSWYGNSFERGGDQVVAQLTNQNDKIFNMPVFDDVKGLFGHTPKATMEKNERVQDCIVFELPAETKITDIKELKLSLPMECFGHNGTLYFKIPSEFIRLVADEEEGGQ